MLMLIYHLALVTIVATAAEPQHQHEPSEVDRPGKRPDGAISY